VKKIPATMSSIPKDEGNAGKIQDEESQQPAVTQVDATTHRANFFAKRSDIKSGEPIKTSATSIRSLPGDWRHDKDKKVVGLKNYGLNKSVYDKRHQFQPDVVADAPSVSTIDGKPHQRFSVEEKEEEARANATRDPFMLLYLGNVAAFKVMFYYMSKLLAALSALLER
jgi:hypothetical protein